MWSTAPRFSAEPKHCWIRTFSLATKLVTSPWSGGWHIEQMDLERLAILEQSDHMPDRAERIARSVDGHQGLEHGRRPSVGSTPQQRWQRRAAGCSTGPSPDKGLAAARLRRRPYIRGPRGPGLTNVRSATPLRVSTRTLAPASRLSKRPHAAGKGSEGCVWRLCIDKRFVYLHMFL